jgi:hypothetical protein
MLRWIASAFGFCAGLFGCALVFGWLAVQHGIDVFHTYIVEPVPPPGGYRSLLDVPPATWPNVVIFVVAGMFAKLGAALTDRLGSSASRQRTSAHKAGST